MKLGLFVPTRNKRERRKAHEHVKGGSTLVSEIRRATRIHAKAVGLVLICWRTGAFPLVLISFSFFLNGVLWREHPCHYIGESAYMMPSLHSTPIGANMVGPASSGQVHGQRSSHSTGNHVLQDQSPTQHLDLQNFQHGPQTIPQLISSQHAQEAAHQQQFQDVRGGSAGVGVPFKMEPEVSSDQLGQLQQFANFAGCLAL